MRARDVRFVRPPKEEEYGTVAVFEDLYGNLWDLLEPNESNRGVLAQVRYVDPNPVEAADGTLSLPAAPGKVPGLAGLREMLVTRGLQPELEFLYAVYEDRETGIHRIYYHGQVNGPVPEGMVMIPLDILPWDRIAITAERSMLHRYQQEFRHGAFSIYQGDEISGKVRQISGD